MLRRVFILILTLFLFIPAAQAQEYKAIPECLHIVQQSEKTAVSATAFRMCYYPDTCLDAVDEELRQLIDALADSAVPHLPAKPGNDSVKSYVDAGASIFRTGDSWASFLLTACTADNRLQLFANVDARAYDMATGERLSLRSVVTEEGFDLIRSEVRSQLNAYFPQEAADESKLNELAEQIETAPFTFNTAFLMLHYRADALYPGKTTLMHVRIPYSALAPYLTEEAVKQTDNSAYRMVALTFDDGPARTYTLQIIRAMRMGAANATFFIVGDRIYFGPELISMEHDAGFSVASHNYTHIYDYEMRGLVQKHRSIMDAEFTKLIGVAPSIIRAPGGGESTYIKENIGLPLIHWSLVAREKNITPSREATRLAQTIQDGDIVLMHDLREKTAETALYLPAALSEANFLCVTVEELFAARGITLEPNTVYYDAYRK